MKKPDFNALAFRNDLTASLVVDLQSPAIKALEKVCYRVVTSSSVTQWLIMIVHCCCCCRRRRLVMRMSPLQLLLEPPYDILLLLVKLVSLSEKDIFAKSVAHFFLYHQLEKFLDMLKVLISDELSRAGDNHRL